jgi:hypothetical protein
VKNLLLFVIFIFSLSVLSAQDAQQSGSLLDMDLDAFDSIFDAPLSGEEEYDAEPAASVLDTIKQRGITFSAGYDFKGVIAPGWNMVPWEFDGTESFSWGQGVEMVSGITIDARLSNELRVITTLSYGIPGFYFSLGDFFFDYNLFNKVFLRAGKYEHSWGISPNFGFTNLLSRVPNEGPSGPSYIVKADVPVGIGGFQLLALTRADVSGGVIPAGTQIGVGGKYNMAFRWADFDLGAYYQDNMATRAVLSIKSTIWNIEFYNEWLAAFNTHSDNAVSFAANLGFSRNLFDDKIELNGEFFYNGEGNTYFFRPESELRKEETNPFIEGFNIALNALYRFGGNANLKFFTSFFYAPMQESIQLVPGITFTPFSLGEIYLAVPMSLGLKDGYYSKYTADPNSRVFSIIFYIKLSGSVYASYYY